MHLIEQIVAIDALRFQYTRKALQFGTRPSLRELRKALAGFGASPPLHEYQSLYRVIATGNWGCGVFLGDVGLKSMLQWIVSSMCDKKMVYFTFGDPMTEKLWMVVKKLRAEKANVSQLWIALRTFYDVTFDNPDARMGGVFAFLMNYNWQPPPQPFQQASSSISTEERKEITAATATTATTETTETTTITKITATSTTASKPISRSDSATVEDVIDQEAMEAALEAEAAELVAEAEESQAKKPPSS